MRNSRNLLYAVLAVLMPLFALAVTPRTTVIDAQNMTCELCPVTVKKALQKVPGVTRVQIDFAKKTATVAFDADRTTAAVLVKATTEAGYPSMVRK